MVDAGDEFSQDAVRVVEQALSMLINRAWGSGRGWGSSSSGLASRIKDRLSESHRARGGEATRHGAFAKSGADADGDAREDDGRSVEGASNTDDAPSMEVVADNEEDFDLIKDVLDSNNVEYSIAYETAPNATYSLGEKTYSEPSQIAVFSIFDNDRAGEVSVHAPFSKTEHVIVPPKNPHTPLSELDDEVVWLLGHFSRDAVTSRLSLAHAAQDIAPAIEKELGISWDEIPLNGPKATLDFTTVVWDERAAIIADPLERLGVPFDVTYEEGLARFEFPAQAAPAVKAVVDFHLGNEASRMKVGRFLNYADLEAAALRAEGTDELVEVSVKDADSATLLKAELENRGVPFESLFSEEIGEETFLMRGSDARAYASELDQARAAASAGKSSHVRALWQSAKARDAAAEQSRARTGSKHVASATSERVSYTRTQTPAADARLAKASVKARRTSKAPSLKPTMKRGGRA